MTEIFQTFDLSMTSVTEVIFNQDVFHQGCQQSTMSLPPKSTCLSEQADVRFTHASVKGAYDPSSGVGDKVHPHDRDD